MAMSRRGVPLSGMVAFWILALVIIPACGNDSVTRVVDDVDELTALKNVAFEFDELRLDILLPDSSVNGPGDGTADGRGFQDDPAAYGVGFQLCYTADNTRANARDARFDGMRQQLILDHLEDDPVQLAAESFSIAKDQVMRISAQGVIDLENHRQPVLYIFRQTIDGEPLKARILSDLLYTIGPTEGSISLPRIQQEIPTRASDEVKEVLVKLFGSCMLDHP